MLQLLLCFHISGFVFLVSFQPAWLHRVLLENAFVLTRNAQQHSQWVPVDVVMCTANRKQAFPEGTSFGD